MGEAAYELILQFFINGQNAHLEHQRIVSHALSNFSVALSCFVISGTLFWFTRKSVLIRSTAIVYMFAAFVFLCGLSHIGHLIGYYPLEMQLAFDFLLGTISLITAAMLFHKRKFILSVVYQFKYVIGLLKTLERLDEVDNK